MPWRNDGIERPAPCPTDDIHGRSGVRTGANGPDNLVEVRHINILVDHNHVPAQIGARVALTCKDSGLFCMPWIFLANRHNGHKAEGRWRCINGADLGNTRLFHGIPYQSRSKQRPIHSMNGGSKRRSPAKDRILPVIQSLHPYHRLGTPCASIIPWPFSKRPFRESLPWNDLPFNGNLSKGWNTKSRKRGLHQLDRLTQNASSPFIFIDVERHRLRGCDEKERMLAEHHRHGEALTGAHRLFEVDSSVLTG